MVGEMETHCIVLTQQIFWTGLACGTGLGILISFIIRLISDSR